MIPIHIREEWQIVQAESISSGLINDSFKIRNKLGDILFVQKINSKVFKDPKVIQKNLRTFLSFMDDKWSSIGLLKPELISEKEDEEKLEPGTDLWRLMKYFPDLDRLPVAFNEHQLASLGEKYGSLINLLRGFSIKEIESPLPGFFNTETRYEQLLKAEVEKQQNETEDQSVFERLLTQYKGLEFSRLVESFDQVCINDCKIGNALFDGDQVKALVDFDTLMIGSPYFEFADLFRSSCWDPDENSELLPSFKPQYFKSLSKGFWNGSLVKAISFDPALALEAIKNLIWQQSSRFLADHFQGDIYYKSEFRGQNLQRAKNQLHLLEKTIEMEPRLLLDLEPYIFNKKT